MIFSMLSAVTSDNGDRAFGALVGTVFFSTVLLIPLSVLIFLIMCLLTAIPAAVAIWLGNKFRMRSVWFFGCAGAVIGGLSQIVFFVALLSGSPGTSPLFVLAGLTAGLAYWWVAERRPGGDRT
jgi:hypothetical protein